MAVNDHVKLRGVTHFNKDELTKTLRYGIKEFLKWGFLSIGAFESVALDDMGVYGGNRSLLRLAEAPPYDDGRVWEGFRKDWVYETGVPFTAPPVALSGVYINGTFHPSNTVGAFAHKVDYPNGRVIFSSAISTTSTVKAEFSHRSVNFVDAEEPWFKELMFDSHHVEHNDFSNQGSGKWSQHPQNRHQLPCVAIEFSARRPSEGFELGSQKKVRLQDVVFYVLAENPDDRDQIQDILERQDDKTFWIPNKNSMKINQDWPLDFEGSPITNFKTFPQLVAATGVGGYRWRTVTFNDTRWQDAGDINPQLFGSIVRTTVSLLL